MSPKSRRVQTEPRPGSTADRLALEIAVGDGWTVRMAGCGSWPVPDVLEDADLAKGVATFRELAQQAVLTDEQGRLSLEGAAFAADLRVQAAELGGRLTSAVLSDKARRRIVKAVHAGARAEPPFLVVKVRPEKPGTEEERRADRALALPWELLRIDERFPVEDGTLDLVREAVVDDLDGLDPPEGPLAVVATLAAPIDEVPLQLEDEMYHLWRAMGGSERSLLQTDLGTLEDLAQAVEHHGPPILHFTGHGGPGALLFEDVEARGDLVPIERFVRRLRDARGRDERGRPRPLPRLVFLSACHGTTAEAGPAGRLTSPSTAAALHRAGFAQVVGYFGKVGDLQATRVAAGFYLALASGKPAWEALRAVRRVSTEPHREKGRCTHLYPLGWAQLALYHRGRLEKTVLPAEGGATVDLQAEERQRIFARLDQKGGTERVETGIRGVQRLRCGFVGRRAERAQVIRRWRSGQRLLVVQGLGGLGKTALCTEVAPLLADWLKKGGARVLALDGRFARAQADPVFALWQEVQAAREDERWSATLAGIQEKGLNAEALAAALLKLAGLEGGLLVYLDDAESLQAPLGEGKIGRWRDAGMERFWEVLVEATAHGGQLGVLASSRYVPEGTPDAAVVALPAMRPFEIVRLLAWTPTLGRMPAKDRDWLAGQIDGHPRTIEYLEVLARQRERRWDVRKSTSGRTGGETSSPR